MLRAPTPAAERTLNWVEAKDANWLRVSAATCVLLRTPNAAVLICLICEVASAPNWLVVMMANWSVDRPPIWLLVRKRNWVVVRASNWSVVSALSWLVVRPLNWAVASAVNWSLPIASIWSLPKALTWALIKLLNPSPAVKTKMTVAMPIIIPKVVSPVLAGLANRALMDCRKAVSII